MTLSRVPLSALREMIAQTTGSADLEPLVTELARRTHPAAEPLRRAARRRLAAFRAHDTRRAAKGDAPRLAPLRQPPAARPERAATRQAKPLSLCAFLVRAGGVQNQGGELIAAIGSRRTRPGLMNNRTGRTLDRAAMLALAEGYFPEHETTGAETMTPAALLDAIDAEVRHGRRRYPGGEIVTDAPRAALIADKDDAWAAQAWRDLVAIAERDGHGEAWRFIAARAGIETEVPW